MVMLWLLKQRFKFWIGNWPKRKDGHNSTSGTTATVAIIRDNKLYIAHVGDSAAVLAKKVNNVMMTEELTVDHKPDNPDEKSRYWQELCFLVESKILKLFVRICRSIFRSSSPSKCSTEIMWIFSKKSWSFIACQFIRITLHLECFHGD